MCRCDSDLAVVGPWLVQVSDSVYCWYVQVVFGRVVKSASAPTSPCVSRSSTPGPPSEVDFDDGNEDDEHDDDDDDVGEADSEEEREELNKRETPTRQLTSALRDATPNPAGDILPA